MTAFAAAMARGLEPLYRKFGETACLRSRDGYVTDCTVIVNRDVTTFGDAIEVSAQSVLISVRKTEVSAKPKSGEKFVLPESDEEYLVDRIVSSDELEHRLIAA